MTPFADAQVDAIRDLQAACGEVPFVLVGAMALLCHFEKWEGTRDLDLSVAASVDELESIASRLTGWKRDPRREHEWTSPGGVLVDLLPAGPEILNAGEFVWPGSGRRMNMVGFRLVLDWNIPIAIDTGEPLRVAPVPAIALLKMAAYLDRPLERSRDLRDLAHIWDEYEYYGDGRYLAAEADATIGHESAGAFLIGHELAQRINENENSLARAFLAKMTSDTDQDNTLDRMAREGPRGRAMRPDDYLDCAAAMLRGLETR